MIDISKEMSYVENKHLINLPIVDVSEDNSIFPLVINVVAKYWGEDLLVPRNRETSANYDKSKGSILFEGLKILQEKGFIYYAYKGSLKDLKKRIDQGIPPIVIMPGIANVIQHATIISGYDDEERRILIYVPKPDTYGAIPEQQFESEWSQDDNLTILLVPNDMKSIVEKDVLVNVNSNRLCLEAEKYLAYGRLNDAIELLKNAINIDKTNSFALFLLGSAYNELGNSESLSCLNQVISINPKHFLALRGLGNYYLKQKDYVNAENYYNMAINVNPKRYSSIYKNRAIARLNLGKNGDAKLDFLDYLKNTNNPPDYEDVKKIIETL